MDALAFWIAVAPLGVVRLIVRNAAGLFEIDRAFEDPQLTDQFVNFPGRPIDVHFTRAQTYQLEFRDGPNAHTGRTEHGIYARGAGGNELFRLFLVRPEGQEEHDPTRVAAYQALKEQVLATV